ncbi:TIR domain-containing protein [Vreelandella neptunia]|uniref:TIR domain-containing protein n=1 Tax=Vreelandella neptunia TaxID=115551 RepID=A0ABZ0YKZ0_9GAMM|nr:TIR domain-containing protein [Halomonas neptunia]MDN3562629.1 TIR domain-containing protein [Halomonas neptunia]TDV99419.1 TIR-like protein DUF1863 [Halomonas alkaliantarctica]WQH12408.1 TIR domain-containing protein [Halomonas neptunia]
MNIFVSYTTRDSYIDKEFLAFISNNVSIFGLPYIDLLDNYATDKQTHVETMLHSSDLVLLLSSKLINESHWVHWELTQAKKLNIPILEVCVKENNKGQVSEEIFSRFKLYTEANKKIPADA